MNMVSVHEDLKWLSGHPNGQTWGGFRNQSDQFIDNDGISAIGINPGGWGLRLPDFGVGVAGGSWGGRERVSENTIAYFRQ